VDQAVPLSYLFLVQGALNLGSQILLMPGGGGTVDAGYAAFLSPYLDRETLAFTLLVWRTYTFYWFLIVGGPIFLFAAACIDSSAVIVEMLRLASLPALIAIPLFTFSGYILAESKAPQRMLALAEALFGTLPGGLAIVALFTTALFTAFTGASGGVSFSKAFNPRPNPCLAIIYPFRNMLKFSGTI